MAKRFKMLPVLLLACLLMTGCLSHWFLESSVRLQVENSTDNCTILSIDVLGDDEETYRPWIKEKLKPGERSHVYEGDWVGEFNLRLKFTRSADGSGKVHYGKFKFDTEGGSIYLMVGMDGDSLYYRFR
ncbi:MAG: hypothetical protein HUK20_05415 [Fibrobacter sp.]|nr:hypothetical protein [Fibrobacter sp.]